jgi:hypothetical protein
VSRLAALAAFVLVGCATGSDESGNMERVGPLELALPAGWTARDIAPDTREWVPARNDRLESITVIVGPKFLGSADRAFRETRTALGLLPESRVVGSAKVSTKSGLTGMQFDVKFRPPTGNGSVYRRSHVVLHANDHTFHVLYTTGDPDPSGSTLAHVLDTIHLEG